MWFPQPASCSSARAESAVPANADKGYLVDNVLLASSNVASACQAPPPGAITFEPPYTPGDINGQQGWLKTGPYAHCGAFSGSPGVP